MNVLFLCSGNSKFGISPIIRNQAESLIAAGVTVDFFAIQGKGVWGYLRNVIPLRNHLKKNHYEIIHAHYGFCGIVGLLAKSKEKIVMSYMGSDILYKGESGWVQKLKALVEVYLNLFVFSHFFDHVIIKSREMSDHLSSKIRKTILPNGINLMLFQPEDKSVAMKALGIESINKKTILFGSDPSRPEKNYALAEKAISILNGLALDVLFLKGIENKLVYHYYNLSDVLILTSFYEGSPNVIKEAMACNCPIVSTDVGDVKHILDGVDGTFICSNDPYDLAEKIRKAIEYNNKTNGRSKLLELGLDDTSVASKIVDIYSKILDKN